MFIVLVVRAYNGGLPCKICWYRRKCWILVISNRSSPLIPLSKVWKKVF